MSKQKNFESCEDLRNWLQNKKCIELVEADMDPEDSRMGRCQFMFRIIPKSDSDDVRETLDNSNAKWSGPNPMGAYNIALPPQNN